MIDARFVALLCPPVAKDEFIITTTRPTRNFLAESKVDLALIVRMNSRSLPVSLELLLSSQPE